MDPEQLKAWRRLAASVLLQAAIDYSRCENRTPERRKIRAFLLSPDPGWLDLADIQPESLARVVERIDQGEIMGNRRKLKALFSGRKGTS